MAGERGVIFDLDGVLIDTEPLQYAAYSQVLADFDVAVDETIYAAEWIATGRGPEYAVRTFALPITPEELKARKEPIYHALLQERVTLMPGAAAAVERMAAAFPIALATNSNAADTGHVLDRFGLAHHFTAVVTREQYEEAKPAPDAFLAAVAALGVAPSRCLVVEDAERGVRAAHAAGIPCVAVPNAWTQDHDFALAISRVASLDDLTSARVEEWVDTEVAS